MCFRGELVFAERGGERNLKKKKKNTREKKRNIRRSAEEAAALGRACAERGAGGGGGAGGAGAGVRREGRSVRGPTAPFGEGGTQGVGGLVGGVGRGFGKGGRGWTPTPSSTGGLVVTREVCGGVTRGAGPSPGAAWQFGMGEPLPGTNLGRRDTPPQPFGAKAPRGTQDGGGIMGRGCNPLGTGGGGHTQR